MTMLVYVLALCRPIVRRGTHLSLSLSLLTQYRAQALDSSKPLSRLLRVVLRPGNHLSILDWATKRKYEEDDCL